MNPQEIRDLAALVRDRDSHRSHPRNPLSVDVEAALNAAADRIEGLEGAEIGNRILWNERDGEIDEVVLSNVNIHIEQMNKGCWWIGIYDRTDNDRYWMGNFSAPRKMTFTEQENSGIEWDQDQTHMDSIEAARSLHP